MGAERYSYDEVPYPSHPFAQTHPDRLATIATLFGMQPPVIERSRVLELGCAAGGNLIPLAVAYPEARFVGVELSGRELAEGRRTIAALELGNIELLERDIRQIGPELGAFDYVICHGVYSWVPADVRDKILGVCAQVLAPTGVAYVSYNTYPGWHLRGTVRDIMAYHARKFQAPQERVAHARALLDFLVRSVPAENSAYGTLLKNELDLLAGHADSYLFHEHLEQNNTPLYFYQFDEHARAKGLKYLAEAELGAMSLRTFPSEVSSVLHGLAASFEEMEQYMDFVRNRMFRQTLLCRADVELDRVLRPERLRGLCVASPVQLEGSPGDSPTRFVGSGRRFSAKDPLLTVALVVLGEAWPQAVPFDRLLDNVTSRIGMDGAPDGHDSAAQRLGLSMLECYARGLVDLHACPPRLAGRAGERPGTTGLARLQAQSGSQITNLRHERVQVSELARRMLPLLDGSRGRPELLAALANGVRSETLAAASRSPEAQLALSEPALEEALERALAQLARDSLLVS